MPVTVWFRFIGWNMKSPTLVGKWPKWSIRRRRASKRLAALKPDVFCGIEMGSRDHVKWLRDDMRKRGWLMSVATGGRNWRYILFNPVQFRQLRGGQVRLGGAYQGDVKEMTWAQLVDRESGRMALIFCSHLEVDGPDSYRRKQARFMLSEIERIKNELKMSWEDCYLYADVNDRGGVQAILNGSRLKNLVASVPYDTMNRWSGVRRRVGRNKSMDVLMAGDGEKVAKTFSPDCSDSSDHNLVGADVAG